jgi:hypothetical protein
VGLLGCTHPKNLVEANAANASGYWESERLSYFNDDILEAAGSSWDDWAACAPDWITSPMMGGFAKKAMKMYAEEYGDAALTVFKDPRLCRLLPFWLPLLRSAKITPYVIHPIRNPKEVASSLTKRNGTDPYYGHLFWLRHVLEAEAGSRGVKRAFVTYNDLMESYSVVVSATQEQLGLQWPRRSARTSEEIEAFLTETHRHQRVSDKALLSDPSMLDWLRQTYEIMLKWADQGEDPEDYPILDAILADFNLSAQRFGRLIYRGKVAKAELIEVNKAVIERDGQIAHLSAGHVSLAAEIVELKQQHDVQLAAYEAQLIEREAQIAELAESKAVSAEEIAKAASEIAVFKQHHEAVVAAYEAQLSELVHSKAISADEVGSLRQQIEALTLKLERAVADYETQLIERDGQINELTDKGIIANEEVVKLKEEVTTLKSDLSSAEWNAEKAMITLEAERADARARLDEIRAEREAAVAALAGLEVSYGDRLAEAEKLHGDLVQGFKDTFALAEEDNEALTKRLKEAEVAIENLEDARRTQLFEMNQVRSSLAQKKAEADDYHFQLRRFEAERSELSTTIAELKAEISAAKSYGGKLASQIQEIVVALDKSTSLPFVPGRFKRARNRRIVTNAGLVNTKWYLQVNPDVSALGVDPALHYVTFGAQEGRSPNPEHEAQIKLSRSE